MMSLVSHHELAGILIHLATLRLMLLCFMTLVLMHSSSAELTQMTQPVCSSLRIKALISYGDHFQITSVSRKKFSQGLSLTELLGTVCKNALDMTTNMNHGLALTNLGFKMTQLWWVMTLMPRSTAWWTKSIKWPMELLQSKTLCISMEMTLLTRTHLLCSSN